MGRFKRQQAKQRVGVAHDEGAPLVPAMRSLPKPSTLVMENGSTLRVQPGTDARSYHGIGGAFSAYDKDQQVERLWDHACKRGYAVTSTSTVSATRSRREDTHQRLLRRKIIGLILRAIGCAALGALSVYAAYRVFVELTGTN